MPDDLQFAMPAKVTDLSIVPEDLRDFYRQSNQGQYYVRIDPKKVTGTAEETTRRLQAIMAENERLKSANEQFKEIDLESYQALMAKKEELMAAEAVKNGEVEAIRRQIEQSSMAKVQQAQQERDLAFSIAQSERLSSEFDRVFERAGVVDDEHTRRLLRKDLLDFVVPQIDIQNRKVDYDIRDIQTGPGGHRDQLLNDEGKPMRLSDLLNSRRSVMPWAFGGSNANGGGVNGGQPTAPISAAALEGKHIVNMSHAEQKSVYSRIGSQAYTQRLKNEAAERARRDKQH